uniref:Protein kinase domain-containing protein n=1 Tax=Angiostrongylus cantonensis TaxID=6313 RepID=A0A0K0CT77_ANGCA
MVRGSISCNRFTKPSIPRGSANWYQTCLGEQQQWRNISIDATFICGRGLAEHVDFNFSALRDANHWMYDIISKQHFRLDRTLESFDIFNLSFNGTFVNQKLIGKGNAHALDNGDVISCARKDLHGTIECLNQSIKNCQIQVAVKVLDTTQLSNRFSRAVSKAKDVEKEVSIMLKINHPNCTQFMDWIEAQNTTYIVMELVGGGELFDRIVDKKWEGMVSYLHQHHITHRDIKPENILCMTKDDYTIVKLADFGLAKGGDTSTMKTFCGTPAYMAPEMIDNDNLAYNPRVDMWSLGVVLFTGICGYPPFSDDYTDMDLNTQIKKGRLIFHSQWKFVTLETQYVIKSMLKVDICTSNASHFSFNHVCMHSITSKRSIIKSNTWCISRGFIDAESLILYRFVAQWIYCRCYAIHTWSLTTTPRKLDATECISALNNDSRWLTDLSNQACYPLRQD